MKLRKYILSSERRPDFDNEEAAGKAIRCPRCDVEIKSPQSYHRTGILPSPLLFRRQRQMLWKRRWDLPLYVKKEVVKIRKY